MESTIFELPFDYAKQDVDTADFEKRRDFWDSPRTSQWFKDRGYTLYRRVYEDDGSATYCTVPSMPFHKVQDGIYPYAYYDTQIMREDMRPLCAFDFVGKVAFAQDSLNRHVVIKIVPDNSEEYRISRFLNEQTLDVLRENCIMPVLDFLHIKGFWFVVMPRWGTEIHIPEPQKTFEVLDIMHSMLKALSFLHHHNISHGDIKFANVAIDHFGDATAFECNLVRPALRLKRLLSYAMFDFDYSIMLPPGTDRMAYRLPYQRSWGTFNPTMDTAQGEFDFNPFVLDVGALGVEFCRNFQHLCRQIPFLAPLLDRMTTRHLEKRFTASEALLFFEQMYSQLTENELCQPVVRKRHEDDLRYYEYNRWAALSPTFVKEWALYREPPVPWTTRLLRKLCGRIWALHAVAYVRWFSFKTVSLFRSLFLRLWSN